MTTPRYSNVKDLYRQKDTDTQLQSILEAFHDNFNTNPPTEQNNYPEINGHGQYPNENYKQQQPEEDNREQQPRYQQQQQQQQPMQQPRQQQQQQPRQQQQPMQQPRQQQQPLEEQPLDSYATDVTIMKNTINGLIKEIKDLKDNLDECNHKRTHIECHDVREHLQDCTLCGMTCGRPRYEKDHFKHKEPFIPSDDPSKKKNSDLIMWLVIALASFVIISIAIKHYLL